MQPLTVPGTLDSLKLIRDYVTAAAAEAKLDKKASYGLRLAVDEIATNIITHGYSEAGLEGCLDVRGEIDDKTLTIVLEDIAPPYDPLQTDQPASLDVPLEDREIGGLGVYLAIRGVDRFLYERREGRNRNIFVVHRK